MESFLIWIPLPKTQRRIKTLRYDKFELANRCPELGQNNDSQSRHRICNERQSLAIAMYRTVEYENKKKIFLEFSSATLPGVTDTVAALGVPSHSLWRNVLTRL